MFCEQGQQNTCSDVNIRLKSSVLYVTQQSDNGLLHKIVSSVYGH